MHEAAHVDEDRYQAPMPLNPAKVRRLLTDETAHALPLFTVALHTFGPRLFEAEDGEPMDPSEIWAELHEVYDAWITEDGENRLNALLMALQGGDMFYKDTEIFHAVCAALWSGDIGDLISGQLTALTPLEIMWATMCVELAREDEEGPPAFGYAVRDYMKKIFADEPDDQEQSNALLQEEFRYMLDQLRMIGVPAGALRLWDAEYAETVDYLNALEDEAEAEVQ